MGISAIVTGIPLEVERMLLEHGSSNSDQFRYGQGALTLKSYKFNERKVNNIAGPVSFYNPYNCL